MPTVKNKLTGLTFDVPDGHFSLTDPELYEVVKKKAKPARKKPAAKAEKKE